MTGTIFIEQLKRSWRQILYWGGGLAGLAFFMSMILQDSSMAESYADLLGQFPPVLVNALGLEEASQLAEPEGFLSFAAFMYGSIIMAVFAVMAGLNIIANDEDSGEMNVMLALPIPRWRIIVEKFLAYIIVIVGITLMLYLGIWIGSMITPVEINMGKMFTGSVNLIPAGISIMGITVFVTSLFANKMISTGIAAAFVMGSYVLNVAGEVVQEGTLGDTLSGFSIWHYFETQAVVFNGINPANVVLLVGIGIVGMFAATFFFERRDVAG